jgi:hypothetical protein
MFWPVTVLQGSARSLYSVQVDASSNIGVFLSSVRKCRTAKVNNELTSSFLLNWRNSRRKLFNYWLRLTVKIACLVLACLNGTNIFRKAEKDDDRPGRPRTAVTGDNIQKVQDVTWKDWRLGVRAVAEEVNLDRESVRRILRQELNMRKICAKMDPKLLSPGQRASPQRITFEANVS